MTDMYSSFCLHTVWAYINAVNRIKRPNSFRKLRNAKLWARSGRGDTAAALKLGAKIFNNKMKVGGKPSNGMPPPENVFVTMTFDPWPSKRNYTWPDCRKYLCRFWFKFFRWFRSCRVHRISITVAVSLWSLNPWPWKCHHWHVDLVLNDCDEFHYVHVFRIYNDEITLGPLRHA